MAESSSPILSITTVVGRVTSTFPPDPAEGVVFAGDGRDLSVEARTLEAAVRPATMIVGCRGCGRDAATPRVTHRLLRLTGCLRSLSVLFVDDRWSCLGTVVRSRHCRPNAPPCSGASRRELAARASGSAPMSTCAVSVRLSGAGYTHVSGRPLPFSAPYLVAGIGTVLIPRQLRTVWGVCVGRRRGAEVVMIERVGSHGSPYWPRSSPLMVAWAFGTVKPDGVVHR